jgi:hypothetical protein
MVRATYHHWPQSHLFRPKNEDHLRYWLEVEAGHFTVTKTIRVRKVEPKELADLLTAVLRTSEDDKIFVDADADLIVVKRANSIAYEKLLHLPACRLFDEVSDIIEAETGIKGETMLKEHEKAA